MAMPSPSDVTEQRKSHWDATYQSKGEAGVSWFEELPVASLEMIGRTGASSSLIDVGGGASRLVDVLAARGWTSLSVLDVSSSALDLAKRRLGPRAEAIEWIAADVTKWQPARKYNVWHDRAAFHFLTEAVDRAAYIVRLGLALVDGGYAVLSTFASDGPERCSGLPIVRYTPEHLADTLGSPFELLASRHYVHATPWGAHQPFQISLLRKAVRRPQAGD